MENTENINNNNNNNEGKFIYCYTSISFLCVFLEIFELFVFLIFELVLTPFGMCVAFHYFTSLLMYYVCSNGKKIFCILSRIHNSKGKESIENAAFAGYTRVVKTIYTAYFEISDKYHLSRLQSTASLLQH